MLITFLLAIGSLFLARGAIFNVSTFNMSSTLARCAYYEFAWHAETRLVNIAISPSRPDDIYSLVSTTNATDATFLWLVDLPEDQYRFEFYAYNLLDHDVDLFATASVSIIPNPKLTS
ncbi:hypothetical protein EXIGLDRAFT_771872 [Exidia glandulosa HHB12029]|uniref:Uncharacterized protein n=1 Tax=Exidia glandulosa HHB12029 TaxID=1314781 RepID=A0A165FNU4_EXIGL|nr:hypothetical protein EXIGLDRAFT_771872 [Exidia glandulosa HHB12029]